MKATDANGVPLASGNGIAEAEVGATLAGLAAGSPEVTSPVNAAAPESVPVVQAVPASDAQAPSAAAVEAARRVGRHQRRRIAAGPRSATGVTSVAYRSQVSGSDARPAATGAAVPSSPVQSIRDQVGAIFSAHPSPKASVLAQAKPGTAERPANAPAVLSVSGVGQ